MTSNAEIIALRTQIRQQIDRCNDLLEHYEALGPIGYFGHGAISDTIENAVASMVSEDPVRMVEWLEKLKGCQ